MNRMMRWGTAIAAGLAMLLFTAGPALARPDYVVTEKKPCSFCHVGKPSDKTFTNAGTYYSTHHTLKGFEESEKTTTVRESSTQKYVKKMTKTVAGLRRSEKTLKAAAGSDPFRNAVLDHLKKLDDLAADHLRHMEEMEGQDPVRTGKAAPAGGK